MKREIMLLAAACALWLASSVVVLTTGSVLAEWLALAAGLGLIAAIAVLRRRDQRATRRWRAALDAMRAGVVFYDPEDRLAFANADFRRLYEAPGVALIEGMPFEELLRTRVHAGLVPEALGREQAWIAERIEQHRSGDDRSFLREMTDGRWRRITEQRLADGSHLGFSIDVTDLVQQQRALDAVRHDAEHAHLLLHDAVEALPDGFALYDADDRLVLCNRRYRDIYSASAAAMEPGATFEQILRYGLERGQYPQAAQGPEAWLAERVRRHREPGGEPILQELPGNRWLRIDERRTRAGGIAGVRTDVSELVRTRQELERLSSTDALTALANRRRFDAALADEVQRAHRHGTALTLLLVDIDHFKLYNDHHGHPEGDRALQAVAAVLARQARRPGELVARFGGEEFALLLPHADAATASAVAERCRVAMATLALPHGNAPTSACVTLSIGGAVHRATERESSDSLVRRADAALYAAKAAGRARCVMADDEAPP